MNASNEREFQKAIIKEVNAHIKKSLENNLKRTSSKRRTNPPICMGVQTKEVHQYQIIIQTQVMRQRP